MMEQNDFISNEANGVVDAMNDKIAAAAIEVISDLINLDDIIAKDLESRIAKFQEAKDLETDQELKDLMQEPTLEFRSTLEKFQYAFTALTAKWLILTHDVLKDWTVNIKIFKLEKEVNYKLSNKSTISIEKLS